MRRIYPFHMLGVAALHLAAFGSFISISGKVEALPFALASKFITYVIINLIGAAVIFAPIQAYLTGRSSLLAARNRIHRLPYYSALWAMFLVITLTSTVFFGIGALCVGCDPDVMRPFYFSMIILFSTFIGIFIYFLIDDFTATLRLHIFEQHGELIQPKGSGLRMKFVMAFISIGVLPVILSFLEAFVFEPVRAQQGISTTQGFLFDFVLIAILIGASFYFIQKNLSKPVESLMEGMRRVGEGKLDVKSPILSDDEIGRLTAGFNGMLEDLRDREFVKETFGKYVPQQVAKAILENKGEAKPQNRLATILYTDIQGFTTVCERLSPEDVVALLNEYFSLIVGFINRHGGVVNQFQGDALLVTFNVPVENPNHAKDAIRAALEIEEALEGHIFTGDIELVTRIGINTGRVVAGAVGADERLNYTVHGDAVNIAARLESLNKEFGTRVLVSGETKSAAGDDFVYEAKGDLPIRGKSQSVKVYAVQA